METKVTIEIRTQNVVFNCGMCQGWFNVTKNKAFAVTQVESVAPTQAGQYAVNMKSLILCSDCYTANVGSKGLQFKDPNGILMPETKVPADLLKK